MEKGQKQIYTVSCSGTKIKRPLLPLVNKMLFTREIEVMAQGMNLKEDLFWSNEIRWGTPTDLTDFTSPISVDQWNLRDYQRLREEDQPAKGLEKLKARFLELNAIRDQMEQ
ncbi:hypothetical protein BY996DRAFT_6472818 [Phakopsora pachyrhizi]|nr:hypothetical protein BY996DRAFT_6472818 [Phakopsora pachyrhizi]